MSKFTHAIIWREALETTAERKSAAIVLPCRNGHNPPSPRNTTPRLWPLFFWTCQALFHQNQFGFRNSPALTATADDSIVSKRQQRIDPGSKIKWDELTKCAVVSGLTCPNVLSFPIWWDVGQDADCRVSVAVGNTEAAWGNESDVESKATARLNY